MFSNTFPRWARTIRCQFLEGDVDLPTKAVSNQALSIRAAKVEHVQGMLCVGYTVEEGDPIPRINRDRAVALGVGEGKIYDCLKLGLTVKSDDGTRDVKLDDVILEAGSGRKVTFMGDCTFASKEMMSLAKGSDLVLHEATLGDSQENERTAKSRGHSVPRIAAEFGRRVGAKEVKYNDNEYGPLKNVRSHPHFFRRFCSRISAIDTTDSTLRT